VHEDRLTFELCFQRKGSGLGCRSLALHNDGACDAFQVEAMINIGSLRYSVRVRVALVLWRRWGWMQQRTSVELDWETHIGKFAGDCNEDGNEAEGRGDAIECCIHLRSVRMPNTEREALAC
jgi:hypothetical protein